ncbi:MAG: hypothetical protein ACI3XM_00310 [Eubacteriales bacterium]
MNRTKTGQTHAYTTSNGDTPGIRFRAGMERYALARREQAQSLAFLAAIAGIGICIGVFCYFFFGRPADADVLARDYMSVRAFSSYPSLKTYTDFFCGWYCHHLIWLLAVLPAVLTVYPVCFCAVLCAARGAAAGFTVCMLSDGFSAFTVYLAAAQGALCAFLFMACAKGICYAKNRRLLPRGVYKQFSLAWIAGDFAPMLCGILFSAAAQLLGMLFVSAVCCFFT